MTLDMSGERTFMGEDAVRERFDVLQGRNGFVLEPLTDDCQAM